MADFENPDQQMVLDIPELGVEDRDNPGLGALGWMFLAGTIGAGALHNVPQVYRTKAALALEDIVSRNIKKIPFLEKLLPGIIDETADDSLRALNPKIQGAIDRRLRGNYVHDDLATLLAMLKQEGISVGGNVEDVQRALLEKYFVGNVKSFISEDVANAALAHHSITFESLQKLASSSKQALNKIASDTPWASEFLAAGQSLRELGSLPAFSARTRKFLEDKGIDVSAELAAGRSVGSFFTPSPDVYIKFQGAARPSHAAYSVADLESKVLGGKFSIQTAARFTPQNILNSLTNVRIPGLGWKPLRVLYPTELARRGPGMSFIGPELASRLQPGQKFASTLYAGGKIFGIQEMNQGGTQGQFITDALGSGYNLGRLRTGMGRGYLARIGGVAQAMTTDQLLTRGITGNVHGPVYAPSSFYGKVLEGARSYLIKAGDKLGFGPQFKTGNIESRGAIGDFVTRIFDVANAEARITAPFSRGSAIPTKGTWATRRNLFDPKSSVALPSKVSDLGFVERTLLNIGIEPRRTVLQGINTKGGAKFIARDIEVARFGGHENPREILDYFNQAGGNYAFKTGEGVSDFANYLLTRVGWLPEAVVGVGMKPGRSPLGTFGRWMGLAASIYGATQVLSYADFKIKQITGTNVSETLAGSMLWAHYGQLKAQDMLGITSKVRSLEEQYPGIESSELSKALRGGAFALGGAILGRTFNRPGLGAMAGLALGGLNLITDFTKSAEDFRAEIEGRKQVLVKRSRWWGLGRQPFEGEGTMMAVPHWYQMMKSDYRDKSIYGSTAEAWRGSWLPTPENMFLGKNLFDPYFVERRNFETRPYPVSAPLFHDIPLVGPLLSATLGKAIKPTVLMHQDASRFAVSVGNSTISQQVDEQLNYTPTYGQIFPSNMKVKTNLDIGMADALYNFKEFAGLPGFMYESVANMVGFRMQRHPMLADAGSIESVSRDYYDRQLGGLFGTTELVRRFITPENKWDNLNTIPALMSPDWLPGVGSIFTRDRRALMDFHTGDPYTRIPMGEARLPGPGYEALHRLHSGKEGVYDPVDRFNILADVAPSSAAYRSYKTIVERWIQSGLLDDEWTKKYYESVNIAQKRLEQLPAENERRFTRQQFYETNVVVDKAMGPGRFLAGGKIYKLAGVETDPGKLAAIKGLSAGTIREQLDALSAETRSLVGQQISIKAGMRDGSDFPVVVGGINSKYIQSGLDAGSGDAISTYAKYGKNTLAEFWENIRHVDLPGPLGMPLNKAWSRYDAVEQYRRREIEGADFAGWNDPVRNFMKPWLKQTYHFVTGNVDPWADTRANREVDQYFDRLEYLKYRRLATQAENSGQSSSVSTLNQMWRKTMIGMQAPGANWMRDAYGAIPTRERKYFERFSKVQDAQDREKIMRMIPDDLKPIYMGVWNSLDPSSQGMSPTTFSRMGAIAPSKSQFEVDSSVAEYFGTHRIPDSKWLGWTPSMQMDDLKLVTMENAGRDIHDAGMYENQARTIRSTRPYLYAQPAVEAYKPKTAFNQAQYQLIMDQFTTATPNGLGYNRLKYKKRQNYDERARMANRNAGSRFN